MLLLDIYNRTIIKKASNHIDYQNQNQSPEKVGPKTSPNFCS